MDIAFIRYAVRSDKGCYRRNNEDNLFFCGRHLINSELRNPFSADGECSTPAIFGVFDGIGGESDGELASKIAAQTLSEYNIQEFLSTSTELRDKMDHYVATVNQKIEKVASIQGSRMGTTAAIVIITHNEINAYNVGDSRIYTFMQGKLRRLSIDHTLANRNVELHKYTMNEMRQSRDWGKLTACLGIPRSNGEYANISCLPIIPIKGQIRLLLCSDGISDMVPDDVIEKILRFGSPIEAGKRMMSEALNRGGKDNASLIVADISSGKSLCAKIRTLFSI